MPTSPGCDCCPNTFDTKDAKADLQRYQAHGADKTTRALIEAIVVEGVDGASLLDIGGGIGAIQLELLAAGLARAESVDASAAYVRVARAEAKRRGYDERTSGHVGDFVQLAAEIEPAEIVTLDRVVCCYQDVHALLGRSADHATRLVGLVYPRDAWWNHIAARAIAAWGWLTRDRTRWYLYRTAEVDGILRAAGFEGRDVMRSWIWQVVVYRRARPTAATS